MPIVVTPEYGDPSPKGSGGSPRSRIDATRNATKAPSRNSELGRRPFLARNPFEGYGERTSSRPYALRLPDAIDLVLRQMAAEERTQPLRVIDRILYEHLKRSGRLPPPDRT